MAIHQMFLGAGASAGVTPVDFIKMFNHQMRGNDNTAFGYGSDGSIYYYSKQSTWKGIKIDAAGDIVWRKNFSSNSTGTVYGMAVGHQDIQVYFGSSGGNYNLWALDKGGSLLWSKRWQINHSSDTNAGSSASFPANGNSLRAFPNADVGLLLIAAKNVDNSSGSGESDSPIILSFKMSDGSQIGWGGIRSSQSGNATAISIRDWGACIGSSSTQGYFTIYSRKSMKSESGFYDLHRIKGSFYTDDHTGDKNIDFDSSSSKLQSGSGHVWLNAQNNGLDVLPGYSGTNIDSGTAAMASHQGAKGAWINNGWSGTWYAYGSSFSGTLYMNGIAKHPTDSNTIFIIAQYEPSGQGYSDTILTKITNNSHVWSRKFNVKSDHGDFAANGGNCSTYPRKILTCSNGKGLIYINVNGPPGVIGQFDLGSTAPATGTYSLGSPFGACSVVISTAEIYGNSSMGNTSSASNSFTVMGDSDDYEPETATWSSGGLTDNTNADFAGELWD